MFCEGAIRTMDVPRSRQSTDIRLDRDSVLPFQPEQRPRFVGGGGRQPHFAENADRLCHLLGVGSGQSAGFNEKTVLQPNAHISAHQGRLRSEEHTSELQSLMRISYAVFCLKKKNKQYI